MIHERPPGVPTTRSLPLPIVELYFGPKHLFQTECRILVIPSIIVVVVYCRIGHPQVDSLQKLALLPSPVVLFVVRCEPELSGGFLTGTHPFHNFSLLKSLILI